MGWVKPTGFSDPGSTWTDEALAYDGDTGTYAYTSVPKGGWSGYLELTRAAIQCDKVRGWFNEGIVNVSNFELDVYYGGAWHNIHAGEPTYGQYVEFPIGSTESVTGVRFRFYSTKTDSDGGQCCEAEFNEVSGGVTYYQNVGEGAIAPTGDISKMTSKDMGGGIIAPTALLSRMTSKTMGEGAVAPTGALAKGMFVVAGDGAIAPTGELTAAALYSEAVGQGIITPVGQLVKKVSIAVGEGTIAPSGTLSKIVRKMVGNGSVDISGTLSRIATFAQAVGNGTITPTGALSTAATYIMAVGNGIVTPIGALAKKSFMAVGGGSITAAGALIAQKLGGGTIRNLYTGGISAANRFLRRGWH